jgi:hypothetical protein
MGLDLENKLQQKAGTLKSSSWFNNKMATSQGLLFLAACGFGQSNC